LQAFSLIFCEEVVMYCLRRSASQKEWHDVDRSTTWAVSSAWITKNGWEPDKL